MGNYKTIGIDLAKRNFHFVVLDGKGKKIAAKKCGRDDLMACIREHEASSARIAMEACGGSHFWARKLKEAGYEASLLKTLDVKAYARTRQKNDLNDALAIAKTFLDPDIRTVPVKSRETQEICLVHKLRQATVRDRVQKSNALMGHLHEFGYVTAEDRGSFARSAEAHVARASEEKFIGEGTRDLLLREAKEIKALLEKEKSLDQEIARLNETNETAQNLMTMPGVGNLVGSIMATLPYEAYLSARDFSASLGLVPSQHSTGGADRLGGITKRGCRYARTMLIQGARCILMGTSKGRGMDDPLISWAYKLWKRKGFNIACTALANKMARICWGCATSGQPYKARGQAEAAAAPVAA